MSVYSISSSRRSDEVNLLLDYANSLLEVYKKPSNEWHHSPYAALCHVRNHIGRIDKNIQENSRHLDISKSCLPTLVKISQNSNPRAFLRLKNGVIKVGHKPSDIRNYLFRERYGKEQAGAAGCLGLPIDRVASGKAKFMMEAKINRLKIDNERLLPCRNVFKLCEAEVVKHVYPNKKLSDSSAERRVQIDEKLPNRKNEIRNKVVRFSDSLDYLGPTECVEEMVPKRTLWGKIVSFAR